MKKLYYKFLIWLCNRSIERTNTLHEKYVKKMNSCLEVIYALLEKVTELNGVLNDNINLSTNYLKVCTDSATEIIELRTAITQGNGFTSRMEKMVDINEANFNRCMQLVNSGFNLTRMKHELNMAILFSYREFFIAQSKVVNLTHMNTLLMNKIEKFKRIYEG